MNGLDLRPLSLGDILDRTFSLYRRHFLLFIGIAGIPQLLVLAFSLGQTLFSWSTTDILTGTRSVGIGVLVLIVYLVVAIFAYLFSQGGTMLAISELYLGRTTTIAESLRNVSGDIWSLFGLAILSGLAIVGGLILLIVPGIYVACRLLVGLPAALIEKRSPSQALSRSFSLTKDFAGRAFVILVLSVVLAYAATLLLTMPAAIALAARVGGSGMIRFWTAATQVGSAVGSVLITPIMRIATAVFYFDLRVRKEGFDLQFMMDPDAAQRVPRSSDIPSIL
jgi:membrane-anchored glycerophosphoryl diester phosphodiesterase (GDPDase)